MEALTHIRRATAADAPQIAEIWNAVIRDTLATFTTAEKDASALADQITRGTPWWVACVGDSVQGHAMYHQFRTGPGYAHTMEHSIHLTKQASGRGLGRALMQALESHARDAGVHVMVAGVSSANPEGLGFHAHLGYVECGRVLQAGRKWGRWLDLVLMQKILT
jgi:phosphinothricin acetyltransferase